PAGTRALPFRRRSAERVGHRTVPPGRPEGPGDGLVGGWGLAVAAGAFWGGILLAGTLGSARVALWAAVLMTGAAGLWVAAVVRREGWWWRAAFFAAAFVLLGAGWGGLRAEAVASSPLARLAGRSVELRGTVASEPREGA